MPEYKISCQLTNSRAKTILLMKRSKRKSTSERTRRRRTSKRTKPRLLLPSFLPAHHPRVQIRPLVARSTPMLQREDPRIASRDQDHQTSRSHLAMNLPERNTRRSIPLLNLLAQVHPFLEPPHPHLFRVESLLSLNSVLTHPRSPKFNLPHQNQVLRLVVQ